MRPDSFILTRAALLLVLVGALVGCGGEPSIEIGSLIGTEGGSVRIADGTARGAGIEVPAGAVDAPTRFVVAVGTPDRLAAGVRAIGPMITFGPEGSRFATPVRITVPSDGEPMVLLTRPHGASTWTRVDGATWDPSSGLITAEVMHFSDFVPVERDEVGGDGAVDPDAGVGEDAGEYCMAHPRDPRCVPVDPPLPGCDAVAQDCAAGQMCIPTDQESGYDWGDGRTAHCIPAGTVTALGPCDAPSDCEIGTMCVFQTMFDSGERVVWFSQEEPYLPMYRSLCLPVCGSPNLGVEGAPSIAGTCTPGDVCHPVQLWGFSGRDVNDTYGVCAPPPPPFEPRG